MAEGSGIGRWSAILATWVGVLGAGWGGLEALAKYDEEIKRTADASVVQTFALYEMFNRAEMLDVRQRITEALALGPLQLDLAPEAAPTSGEGDPAADAPTEEPPESPQSQVSPFDLVVFVDYFDAVHVCVERRLCDPDLVDRLLKPYAIYDALKGDINAVRDSEKNLGLRHQFGSGIEWLETTDLQALAAPPAATGE